MKGLYKHKIKINNLLFVVAFIFKLAVIQEYIHIEQHEKNQLYDVDCQICHNIFNIAKYQGFEVPEIYTFNLYKYPIQLQLVTNTYNYFFFKNVDCSELYNRPPPQIV